MLEGEQDAAHRVLERDPARVEDGCTNRAPHVLRCAVVFRRPSR